MCSELKQLYVAVTRAKKNLWIVENNRAAGGNIVALWTNTVSNSLVELIDQDDEQVCPEVATFLHFAQLIY